MTDEFPRVEGVEHHFVTANGVRLHVAEAGAGEPIVMLHGWPQHWWEWRHAIPPLADRYRVICPDLRGLGWSEAPPSGYEKENLADDILALFDELGLERARLVGHDWGGWVGFLICLRKPERVSRYLALNIVPPFVPVNLRSFLSTWRFWYQWVIASPLGGRIVSQSGAIGRTALNWVGASCWSPEEREVFLERLRDPERARASVLYYRTFQRELWGIVAGRYRRGRLRTPTRLLFGTGDRVLTPHNLDGIERYADDIEVELVPDSGHFIADERPELVIDRALTFFAT
jgi:pimeloyl-ACP methyl ester carboxylesterase